MWKTLIRPAMIFIPFILGVFCPQAHVLNNPPFNAVRWALVVMVFMSCLQINYDQLKIRKEHWRLLIINLLMGVVPYYLLKFLFPAEPDLYQAAFFVGITPTATAAPVVIAFLNGRVGFALTGFTITNVFIALALLFLLPLITNNFTLDFIAKVGVTLSQVILLPFVLSLIIRKIWPQAKNLPKKCKTFSFSLWSFTLFILATVAREHFIENPNESIQTVLLIGLVSLVICILNFSIGHRLASKKYCRETSQLLGQKNTTFTMYLALQYASPLIAMGPIFYILWHNTWNAIQMYRYDRRRINRSQMREQQRKNTKNLPS